MKKFAAVILSATMLLALASCSKGEEDTAPEVLSSGAQATEADLGGGDNAVNDAQAPVGSSKYGFTFNGKTATADEAADPAIQGYGDSYTYFESPSCAFQGMDKVYTYTSFLVRTYPVNDVDYILSIELRDDSVATPEGIYIGCTEEQVRSTYGEPTSEKTGGLEYTDGSCTLSFVISGGNVTAISYNRVSE